MHPNQCNFLILSSLDSIRQSCWNCPCPCATSSPWGLSPRVMMDWYSFSNDLLCRKLPPSWAWVDLAVQRHCCSLSKGSIGHSCPWLTCKSSQSYWGEGCFDLRCHCKLQQRDVVRLSCRFAGASLTMLSRDGRFLRHWQQDLAQLIAQAHSQ